MKKKITILIGILISSLYINLIPVLAESIDVSEILPGKPSLNTKYAQSFDELTPAQQSDVLKYKTYQFEGEESRHLITALNGRIGNATCETKYITMRADFKFENLDNSWSKKLSSDGTVNFRFFSLKLDIRLDDYEDIENLGNEHFLCMYGDKAEQWFKFSNSQLFPPDKLDSPYRVSPEPSPVLSDENRGCEEYKPIVTVREDYVDFTSIPDMNSLYIYVYYEDEDWLIPESLQFVFDDFNETIKIDDIKATSNFPQYFVGEVNMMYGGTKEEKDIWQAKYDEIDGDAEFYDPINDEGGDEPISTEDEDEKDEENEPAEAGTEKEPIEVNEEEPEETAAPEPEGAADPEPEVTANPEQAEDAEADEPEEPVQIPEDDDVAVYVNGKLLEFDEEPVLENDRVLVPMRKIFEELDAEVIWEQSDRSIEAKKGGDIINLQIGNATLEKNGAEIALDTAPILENDTTMVPIRAVSEALDANVVWNEVSRSVVIETR